VKKRRKKSFIKLTPGVVFSVDEADQVFELSLPGFEDLQSGAGQGDAAHQVFAPKIHLGKEQGSLTEAEGSIHLTSVHY
jgi:hypothetical protein